MTQNGHTKAAEADRRSLRAGSLRHALLSRALPGSIVAVAALTIPEFSAGAGDIDGGGHSAKLPEPGVMSSLGAAKSLPDAAKAPLAGVRYGGMLAIRDVSQSSPALLAQDVVAAKPAQPNDEVAALAAKPAIGKAVPLGDVTHSRPAPSVPLDDAANYAATLLDRMAAQPGGLATALPEAPAATFAKPAAIDVVASYAAMALDSFVDEAPPEPERVAEWAPQREPQAVPATPDEDEAASAPSGILAVGAISLPMHGAQAVGTLTPEPVDSAIVTPVAGDAAEAPTRDALLPDAGPVPSVIAPIAPTASYAPMETAPPVALAAAPEQSVAPQASLAALAETVDEADAPLAFDLRSQLSARVDGKSAGLIDFRQTTTGLSIRLGSIVSVLSDRYDGDDVARITNSAASKAYVSLAELQAQGIPISYDPVYDEFNIGQAGTRIESARSVAAVMNGQARP